MAKKQAARPTRRKSAATTRRKTVQRRPRTLDPLIAPIKGAERQKVGGVRLDIGRAGDARIKRIIYPVGFRWSVDMKRVAGTDLCMHAHAGILARGQVHIKYADGCVVKLKAPQILALEPGHDGWVVGNEPVVWIEVDFEGDTVRRLGMPATHRHR